MRSRYEAAVVAAAGEYECRPEAIAELECIRAGVVVVLAQRRSGNGGYSALEWEEWLTEHSFQSHDMDTAVEMWKAYFRDQAFRDKSRCDALVETGRPGANQIARQLVRDAWKKHMRDLYGHKELAMLFMKHPIAVLSVEDVHARMQNRRARG